MSIPETVKFSKMLILVQSTDSPALFAAPCGITSKGFEFATALASFDVIRDPDEDEWTQRRPGAQSARVSGSGVLAVESFDIWNDWSLSRVARNVQVKLVATGLGYYLGSFFLSSFSLKGDMGSRVHVDVRLESDGAVTWVPV